MHVNRGDEFWVVRWHVSGFWFGTWTALTHWGKVLHGRTLEELVAEMEGR